MKEYRNTAPENLVHDTAIVQRLEFERIVSAISARFVGMGDIAESIDESLEMIGQTSNADRAYLFLYGMDGKTMSNSNEWCAPGIEPQKKNLQDLPSSIFPWWTDQMNQRKIIHISDIEQMPEEASVEKSLLSQQGILSLLVIPVISDDSVVGFIGFDDVTRTGEWFMEDIAILGTVSEIIGNALGRERAEDRVRRERERAESYFDLAPVFMLALDVEGRITNINQRGCKILCAKREELIGNNWFEQIIPHDSVNEIRSLYSGLVAGDIESIEYFEASIMTCQGDERIIAWHISQMIGESSEIIGTLSSGEDVTDRRLTEEQMRRRLMKYKLQDGRLYMTKEAVPEISLQAFNDLLKLNYRGVVISRTPKEELLCQIERDCVHYWLAEMRNGETIPPDESVIEEILEDLRGKAVILIDRIEYVISKIGFERSLACVQRLRELAYIRGFIVILSIDPLTLKREELRLLEKEGRDVEAYDESILHESLSEVLDLVHKQNTIGLKPSYSDIGNELVISKPTMRKRISQLIELGYLREDTVGRMKIVELAEKGKQLFRS